MMSENINYLLVSLSPKSIYVSRAWKSSVWSSKTSRFSLWASYPFILKCLVGKDQACLLPKRSLKKQPCPGLYDLSSAKKLKATCPMGKLEFKVFSNRGIPVVIAYFTVTFCKFICTLHVSFFFISHFSFPSDKKYEAVVLPIFGVATPFHISTIKVGVYLFAFVLLILRIWL